MLKVRVLYVLYQDFVVPVAFGPAEIRFDLFIGNRADRFVTPTTLDFSTPSLNQQARVDLLLAGTDPLSVSPSDVLLNVYQTAPGNPLISGYSTIVVDLTSPIATHSGTTLRLRFAEVDNLFTFQLGVDNVDLLRCPGTGRCELLVLMAFVVSEHGFLKQNYCARLMHSWQPSTRSSQRIGGCIVQRGFSNACECIKLVKSLARRSSKTRRPGD